MKYDSCPPNLIYRHVLNYSLLKIIFHLICLFFKRQRSNGVRQRPPCHPPPPVAEPGSVSSLSIPSPSISKNTRRRRQRRQRLTNRFHCLNEAGDVTAKLGSMGFGNRPAGGGACLGAETHSCPLRANCADGRHEIEIEIEIAIASADIGCIAQWNDSTSGWGEGGGFSGRVNRVNSTF